MNLATSEIHVWRIDLKIHEEAVQRFRGFLSLDEKERAARFFFEPERRRFTVARGAMREILSRYLEIEPQNVKFSYGSRGKPELSPDINTLELKFNLSHSFDLALLAVARRFRLGIDIEFVNRDLASEEIAARFLSGDEISALLALPHDQRVEAFLCCWTRKEAYVKALGGGLSVPLDSFSVAFDPGAAATLVRVEPFPEEVARWSMYNIVAGPEYRAALVVEGHGHRLCFFKLRPGSLAPHFTAGRLADG